MLHNLHTYISDKRSRSIGGLFIFNAFLYGNWTVRIPDFKYLLGLNDAELGLALFSFPVGVILVAPLTAYLMKRYGNGKTAVAFAILSIFSFFFLIFTTTYWSFCMYLYFAGATTGSLDISMNGVTATIERELNKSIMSTTHGFWSIGVFLGATFGGLSVLFHLNYQEHITLICIIVSIILIIIYKNILGYSDYSDNKKSFAFPDTLTIFLICIGFGCFIVEGGIADWGSLYFKEELRAPESYRSLGYAAFSIAMAIMRFNGDRLINLFGNTRVLIVSSTVATIGLALAVYFTSYPFVILAMFLSGLGTAVILPIVFREAANSKIMRPETGLAMVTTFSYSGFLLGPPLLGFISEAFSIRLAFATMGLTMMVVLILSIFLTLFKRG